MLFEFLKAYKLKFSEILGLIQSQSLSSGTYLTCIFAFGNHLHIL